MEGNIWLIFSELFIFNSFKFGVFWLNEAAFGIILFIGAFALLSKILLFILLFILLSSSLGIFLIFILFPNEFLVIGLLLAILLTLLLIAFKLFFSSGGNFLIKVLLPVVLLFPILLFWFICCRFKAWSNPIGLLRWENLLDIDNSWNLPSSSSSVFAIGKGDWDWFIFIIPGFDSVLKFG